MKREYVKPVIESEEFVANEYVAACWYFTCVDGGKGKYISDNAPTSDRDRDPFTEKWGIWIYSGEMNIENCEGLSGMHVLSSAPYQDSKHPNASV